MTSERPYTNLARHLCNRGEVPYQLAIDPGPPYESAVDQCGYDIETVAKLHEDAKRKSIMPFFETIRGGLIERGLWNNELTTFYQEAVSTTGLRELLIRLKELREEL